MHYEGVFWTRGTQWHRDEFENVSDMESRMYAKPAEIEAYLSDVPTKPYISCEYMHAMGNSCGGLSLYTDLEDRYEKYQGGFIWDYLDQAIRYRNDRGETVFGYGGDFDERGCDYEFCGDGIVFADRTVSPKIQEVKQLYAPVIVSPEKGGICIRNRNLFIDTSAYDFVCRVLADGTCIGQEMVSASVEPLSTEVIKVKLFENASEQYGGGQDAFNSPEIIFDVEVRRDAHPVSRGQYIARSKDPEKAFAGRRIPAAESRRYRVVEDDYNIGVAGENFSVLFARGVGLVSLKYDGVEYTTRAPRPTFWRAATDNDRGAGYGFLRGIWLSAGLYAAITDTKVIYEKASDNGAAPVSVEYTYQPANIPDGKIRLAYTVYADGKIKVTQHWNGVADVAAFPAFGWEIKTKGFLTRYSYYGNGPQENYCDRKKGAFAGIYEGAVADNRTPYLVPQECGNRTGIRWLAVTDDAGKGLFIRSMEASDFEGSVLHNSPYELDYAQHREELADSGYTWIRVLAKQMGVGGDDSWGAPVHDEYLLDASQEMEYSFVIEKIHENQHLC